MCEHNEHPEWHDVVTERWVVPGHDDAALREGWLLSPCEGSVHGPLQLQCVAALQAARQLSFAVPVLASDSEAWALVRDGVQPHHHAARELLARFNPIELGRIALGAPAQPVASASQATVMPLPGASGQCSRCGHWQRRGGTLLPATLGCRAFEREQPERTAALLAAVAVERSSRGGCPVCEPLPDEPDAYIAQDLPFATASEPAISTLPEEPT